MGERWTLESATAKRGPALHPLAGARTPLFAKRTLLTSGLSKRSRVQRAVSLAAQLGRNPFAWYESLRWKSKFADVDPEKPVLFLIGHWRSGTTHLHNLMSRDPQFGFMTFGETALPMNMLGKKVEFARSIIDKTLPKTRGYDNVKLDLSEPQEEEMALGNLNPICYYNVYYFPQMMEIEQKRSLLMEEATPEEIEQFEDSYRFIVRKMNYAKEGKQLLFKNPASTSRVAMLKRLFPNAKFINIVRNPWPVFSSSMGKFPRMLNAFAWQDFDQIDYADFTIRNYKDLMQRYSHDRDALDLPASDLVETSYEKITADPIAEIGRIYDQLEIPNKEAGLVPIQEYAESMKSYTRNVHTISPEHAARIREEWRFAFDEWGYPLDPPVDIAIL